MKRRAFLAALLASGSAAGGWNPLLVTPDTEPAVERVPDEREELQVGWNPLGGEQQTASPFGQPVKRPGPSWVYRGGGGGGLLEHVVLVHRVEREKIERLSVRQLRIVHSNLHNGFPALGAIRKAEKCLIG